MARNPEAEGSSSDPPTLPPSRSMATSDPLLVLCRCFNFLTAVVAVLCVIANAYSAVRSFRADDPDIFGGIFRCYAVGIALLVVIAETEWSLVFGLCRILEYWVGRGMLQVFVAVMTRAFHGGRDHLFLLQEIASYMLLACGLVYTISGLLCIGFLKKARQSKEITREQALRDLQELEHKREELRALLIADNV